MNTPNNKRYRDIEESINAAFVSLLQGKELRDITVTDICELAGIERSTFYAHYEDVSALANEYAAKIEKHLKNNRIRMVSLPGYLNISKQIKMSLSFISKLVAARQRVIIK